VSRLSCAEVRDLAPELALGVLHGLDRADVLLHVDECAPCQAVVTEWAEVADHLPLLAPEIEPPAGFGRRVSERRRGADQRRRRRLVALVAAVAAAVAIVSVATVRIVESTTGTPTTAVSGSRPVEVAMRDGGGSGAAAGWVYVSDGHGVALTVDYRVPDGEYSLQVTDDHGSTTRLGTVVVAHERGTWTGRSPSAIRPGSTIALVDAAGIRVCQGTVGPDTVAD